MERIQKKIANSGYTSRRNAEKLIVEGRVKVNNEVITKLGYLVKEDDCILIDNRPLLQKIENEYYLLYKPKGVISSTKDEKNRKTVVDLIDTQARIYPVGRLDYDTTGLLLLTNDGTLANRLMHPKSEVAKTYCAKVGGLITKEIILDFKKGPIIEGRKVDIKNFKIRHKNKETKTTTVELTIVEGRNHIVKKLFLQYGMPVLKLKREAYAFLNLENLKEGEYRKLTTKEIRKLYQY